MSPATISASTLAVGPGYQWLLYKRDGVEYARLSLDDGGLVYREGLRWYCIDFHGTKLWLDPARLEPLRGTAPDAFAVWPEQAELALPADLANNAATGDLLQAIYDEYGLIGPDAWKMASSVLSRIDSERAITFARRVIGDERLAREADLHTLTPITAQQLLAQERPPRIPLFGQLVAEGHNATVVAKWKVGKSTFVDNAAISAATGGMFLARFETPEPLRVVLFNYELHDDDMADRLQALRIPTAAATNITIVNLRGRRMPLTTAKGRDTCVKILKDAAAQLWIVDPFGAAYAAAGGEDENANAEVRRFLIALDEIKRLANCSSLLMPVHTGRKTDQEGDEQGRGATVLEDWPDVRILLTRGKDSQRDERFLRTEGRAWELGESRLTFDATTRRLTLPEIDLGISRRRARDLKAANAVAQVVTEHPGMNKRALREALGEHAGITSNNNKDDAVQEARTRGLIHFHDGPNRSQIHFNGAIHTDAEPCPGGFKP